MLNDCCFHSDAIRLARDMGEWCEQCGAIRAPGDSWELPQSSQAETSARTQLRNVRLLARRMMAGAFTANEAAGHLLLFCDAAKVTDSVLRRSEERADDDDREPRRECEWCGRPATPHGSEPRCDEHRND